MTPEESRRYVQHAAVAASRRVRAKHPGVPSEPAPLFVVTLAVFEDGSARFSCEPEVKESAMLEAVEQAVIARRLELETRMT